MNTSLPVTDRDGVELQAGQLLEIQHCIGSYGRTQIVKGKLIQIDRYYGADIELTEATFWHTKDGRIPKKVGDRFSVSLPGRAVNEKFVCFKRHDDFEHGHEAWVKVIAPTPEQAKGDSA